MRSYLDLLRDVRDNGESHDDRTGVGTLSVFGRQFRHSMTDGFPLLTTKKMPLRWIFEELRWFLSGSTDESVLRAENVDIWKEWATEEQCAKFDRDAGDLGPVYGSLWREFPVGNSPADTFLDANNNAWPAPIGKPDTCDQIQTLIADIFQSPNSRRLIVSGWHPFFQKRVALPPCHTVWQCKVHGDKTISLHLYARSIDIFLGLPFNIASYALLLTLIGKATNLTPRDLIISFGDLHVYKNHLDQVDEQLSRIPNQLPTVIVSDRLNGKGIDALLGYRWSDIRLRNYEPQAKISAPVAV